MLDGNESSSYIEVLRIFGFQGFIFTPGGLQEFDIFNTGWILTGLNG